MVAVRGKASLSTEESDALSSDGFALPDAEESSSSSDESEEGDVEALAMALRRYVMAGSQRMPDSGRQHPELQPPASKADVTQEVDELSDSEEDVLGFRLAVRGYAERSARQC